MYGEPFSRMRWSMQDDSFWSPPTDVYETGECAVVTVEIGGLNEGDYRISLVGRLLEVTGERCDPSEKLAYQRMEIHYGKFRTQVHLPWALDPSGQSATYENGILRIVLRKAQSRRIPVQADDEVESV